MKTGIFIPTYNATKDFHYFNATLKVLSLLDSNLFRVLIIDSSSHDSTIDIIKTYGFEVQVILTQDFDHGKTRQYAAKILEDCEILIYLTQDVKLNSVDSIYNLINVFHDANVGTAFGRQLPHDNADIFATEGRKFNYPNQSYMRNYNDRFKYGVKTVFSSDSFAAYRRSALINVGGFPEHCIVSEDMFVVAKMVQSGFSVAYVADAVCNHSHNYTIKQESHRYFDIGVFFATEAWIKQDFGAAESEGKKAIIKLFKTIITSQPFLLPSFVIRIFIRAFSYKLGVNYQKLPKKLVLYFSAQKQYWNYR